MSVLSTQLIKDFVKATNDRDEIKQTGPIYGTVVRNSDDELVVSLDNGVDVPVESFAGISVGDRVLIDIKDHTARITSTLSGEPLYDGNGNIIGYGTTIEAGLNGDVRDINQHFWHDVNGAHVGEDASNRTDIDSNGMRIYHSNHMVAEFSKDGTRILDENDNELAHFGYGDVQRTDGTIEKSVYVTLGTRRPSSIIGENSVAEGKNITASGPCSHAEGYNTIAEGYYSHAEGRSSKTSGFYSHAEGYATLAYSDYSHSENMGTTAHGLSSHAEGEYTYARGTAQHVEGKWNVIDNNNTYAHITGNGSADDARKNIQALDWDGNEHLKGTVYVNCYDNSSGGTPLSSMFVLQDLKLTNQTNVPANSTKSWTQTVTKPGYTPVIVGHYLYNNTNFVMNRCKVASDNTTINFGVRNLSNSPASMSNDSYVSILWINNAFIS